MSEQPKHTRPGDAIAPNAKSEREKHAREYALEGARGVAGQIVDSVLSKTGATVPDLSQIPRAEEFIERFVAALLKNSLTEFSDIWTGELEGRTDALEKIVRGAAAVTKIETHQRLIEALKVAEVWLANCVPVGQPTGEPPLPIIRAALALAEAPQKESA